jgi:hypothetical protein
MTWETPGQILYNIWTKINFSKTLAAKINFDLNLSYKENGRNIQWQNNVIRFWGKMKSKNIPFPQKYPIYKTNGTIRM